MASKHYLEWSKEEKDQLANEKMESMRKYSEALRKRHEEVEADKRNAERLSKFAMTNKKGILNEKPPDHHRSTGRGRHFQPSFTSSKVGDLPPPDPPFNLLADHSRNSFPTFEDRHLNSRRHHSNYGGQDFQNVKHSIQQKKMFDKEHPQDPPRNDMEMSLVKTGKERQEYAKWKAERERIDKERVIRQKTSGGQWRREWDNDKVIQEIDPVERPPQYYRDVSWGPKSGYRKGGKNFADDKDRAHYFAESDQVTDESRVDDCSNRSVVACNGSVTICVNNDKPDLKISNAIKNAIPRNRGGGYVNKVECSKDDIRNDGMSEKSSSRYKSASERNDFKEIWNDHVANKVPHGYNFGNKTGWEDDCKTNKMPHVYNNASNKTGWEDDCKTNKMPYGYNNVSNKTGWEEEDVKPECNVQVHNQKEEHKGFRNEKNEHTLYREPQKQGNKSRSRNQENYIKVCNTTEDSSHCDRSYQKYSSRGYDYGEISRKPTESDYKSKPLECRKEGRWKDTWKHGNEDGDWGNFRDRPNKEKYHSKEWEQNREVYDFQTHQNKEWDFKKKSVSPLDKNFNREKYANYESKDSKKEQNYNARGYEKSPRVDSEYSWKRTEYEINRSKHYEGHVQETDINFSGQNVRNQNQRYTNSSKNINKSVQNENVKPLKNERETKSTENQQHRQYRKAFCTKDNLESDRVTKQNAMVNRKNQKVACEYEDKHSKIIPKEKNSTGGRSEWDNVPETKSVTRKQSHDGWDDEPGAVTTKQNSNDGWDDESGAVTTKQNSNDGWDDKPGAVTTKQNSNDGWDDEPGAVTTKQNSNDGWDDEPGAVTAKQNSNDGWVNKPEAMTVNQNSVDGWDDDIPVISCGAEKETGDELQKNHGDAFGNEKMRFSCKWKEKNIEEVKCTVHGNESSDGKMELSVDLDSGINNVAQIEHRHAHFVENDPVGLDDTVDGDDDSWEDVTTSGGESLSGQNEDILYSDNVINLTSCIPDNETKQS